MVVLRLTDVDLDIGENIKFVRDTINGNSINDKNEWVEITLNDMMNKSVRDTPAGIGMIAYTSGPIPDASSVIDGITTDTTTLSVTPGVSASITVELKAITRIKSITVIRKYSDSRIYNNVKTEVSTDGYNWITIYDSDVDGLYPETASGKTTHLKQATVLAGDWEVSDTRDFSNKLITTYNNKFYKDHVVFTDILDPTKTYYGRVRLLLDPVGYTVWFDVGVFIPKDVIDKSRLSNPPGLVSPPRLTIDYPVGNHPGTLFTIHADAFGAGSNDALASTSWIVYDIDDNIIWCSLYDKINLHTMIIDPSVFILNDHQVYRIAVAFHTVGYDSSIFVDKTIHVNYNDKANIIREPLDNINSTIVNNFRILNITDLVKVIITIEKQTSNGNGNVKVYSNTLINGDVNFSIPISTFVSGKDYLVTVEPFTSQGSLAKRYTYLKCTM